MGFTSGDVDGVVELLTDDAVLAMPPAPHEYVGRRAIAAFLQASITARQAAVTLRPTRANEQPAFVCGSLLPSGEQAADSIIVLTMRGRRVSAITRFLDPDVARTFV